MGIMVRAKQMGYYDNKRRREGQVFELSEKFVINGKLPKWVEPVDGEVPKAKSVRSQKKEVELTDDVI
jgi:hypothetical protein